MVGQGDDRKRGTSDQQRLCPNAKNRGSDGLGSSSKWPSLDSPAPSARSPLLSKRWEPRLGSLLASPASRPSRGYGPFAGCTIATSAPFRDRETGDQIVRKEEPLPPRIPSRFRRGDYRWPDGASLPRAGHPAGSRFIHALRHSLSAAHTIVDPIPHSHPP